jgi:hypothetical protein
LVSQAEPAAFVPAVPKGRSAEVVDASGNDEICAGEDCFHSKLQLVSLPKMARPFVTARMSGLPLRAYLPSFGIAGAPKNGAVFETYAKDELEAKVGAECTSLSSVLSLAKNKRLPSRTPHMN